MRLYEEDAAERGIKRGRLVEGEESELFKASYSLRGPREHFEMMA